MPQFIVTAPDGRKFQINAPEGATRAQALAYAQQKLTHTSGPWNKYATAAQGPWAKYAAKAAPPTAAQVRAMDAKADAALVDSMPWYQRALVGAGHGFDQLTHGAEQIGDTIADKVTGGHRLASLDARLADNATADQALMHSGVARAGSIGAQIAASIPLGMGAGMGATALGVGARTLPFVEGAAANGALSGLEPTQGSHLANAATGALVGAAFPAAGRALGAGARLVRNGLQYVIQPGAAADRVVADAFGRDAAARLAGATPDGAGVMPTPAQALGGARAIAAEQAMRRAGTRGAFVNRDVAADAQQLARLRQFAGDATTLQDAIDAREAAMGPYRAALAGKRTDAAPILDAVNAMRSRAAGKPVANAALDEIESTLNRRGVIGDDGTVPLESIEGLRAGMGDILRSAATRTGIRGARNGVALRPVQTALENALRDQVPGFDSAMGDYARLSEPINTQSTLQDFLDRIGTQDQNAAGEPRIRASDSRKLLHDLERSEFGISPDARRAVQDVHNSLLSDTMIKTNVGGVDTGETSHVHLHGLYGMLQHGNPYRGIPGPALPILGATAGGFIGDRFHHPEWGALAGAALGGGAGGLLARRLLPLIAERTTAAPLAGAAIQRAVAPSLLSRAMPPLVPRIAPLLFSTGTTAAFNTP